VGNRYKNTKENMKKTNILTVLAAAVLLGTSPNLVRADEGEKHDKSAKKETADAKSAKSYPLDTCVVSGEKLEHDGKPYVFKHKGQEVKLCCKDCLKDFKKDPDKYVKKIKDAQEQAEK
jgi:YHS domain-containing protein